MPRNPTSTRQRTAPSIMINILLLALVAAIIVGYSSK
jgi:hypothetical protein